MYVPRAQAAPTLSYKSEMYGCCRSPRTCFVWSGDRTGSGQSSQPNPGPIPQLRAYARTTHPEPPVHEHQHRLRGPWEGRIRHVHVQTVLGILMPLLPLLLLPPSIRAVVVRQVPPDKGPRRRGPRALRCGGGLVGLVGRVGVATAAASAAVTAAAAAGAAAEGAAGAVADGPARAVSYVHAACLPGVRGRVRNMK